MEEGEIPPGRLLFGYEMKAFARSGGEEIQLLQRNFMQELAGGIYGELRRDLLELDRMVLSREWNDARTKISEILEKTSP